MGEVKEHPILFSGAMVRAILAGRKTQSRRVIKPEWWRCLDPDDPEDRDKALAQCPYGQPGGRLWVRETWRTSAVFDPFSFNRFDGASPILWVADGAKRLNGPEDWGRTRPSIHMPRWASRITLELVGVRVERLHDITEQDAAAEGVAPNWCGDLAGWNPTEHGYLGVVSPDDDGDSEEGYHRTAREAFAELWDSINAKRGYPWKMNPWVWALTFKRYNGGA